MKYADEVDERLMEAYNKYAISLSPMIDVGIGMMNFVFKTRMCQGSIGLEYYRTANTPREYKDLIGTTNIVINIPYTPDKESYAALVDRKMAKAWKLIPFLIEAMEPQNEEMGMLEDLITL